MTGSSSSSVADNDQRNTEMTPKQKSFMKPTGLKTADSDSASADELAQTPPTSPRPLKKLKPLHAVPKSGVQEPSSSHDTPPELKKQDSSLAHGSTEKESNGKTIKDSGNDAQYNDMTDEQQPPSSAHNDISHNFETAHASDSPKPNTQQTSRKKTVVRKRARKAPAKLKGKKPKDDNEDEDFGTPPSSQKFANRAKDTNGIKRVRYTRKWDPTLVITDSKSILVKAKLMEVLKSEQAWSLLTPDQQRELLTYLPRAPSDTMHLVEKEMVAAVPAGQPLPNIALERLQNSMAFKADVRQFQEELGQGKLEIGWIEQAMAASERRKKGDFDEWKIKERESYWEMTGDHDEEDEQ
jgi:hypothetical protein